MKTTTILLVILGGVLVYELVLKPKQASPTDPFTAPLTAANNLAKTIGGWFTAKGGGSSTTSGDTSASLNTKPGDSLGPLTWDTATAP